MDSDERSEWSHLHRQLDLLQRTLDDTNQALQTLSRQLADSKKLAEERRDWLKYNAAVLRHIHAFLRKKESDAQLKELKEKLMDVNLPNANEYKAQE